MNNFYKKGYDVIRYAVPDELTNFCYKYIRNKRKVVNHMFKSNYLSSNDMSWGNWENEELFMNTYCHYSDLVMETLLEKLLPKVIKNTELNLAPTYSYLRMYKNNDVLTRHRDRPACEISCSLNLGGDEWPLFLDPTGGEGNKGIEIDLEPGDMLIYKGCDFEHWREPFTGQECCQVFFHYNDIDGPFFKDNKYDSRPFLGLPGDFRKSRKQL